MTCTQKIVTGITPKQMAAFGYDIETHFPTIADGRAQFRVVSEDGGYTTHH